MQHFGTNALLAKIDVKEAYRTIPIHPDNQPFLGLHWKGQVYIDCQLPIGLASALAIFSAVGEALEWVLRQRGVRAVVHYLDDILLVGPPGTDECQQALSITLATCEELGVPLSADKTEGPSTSLSFLGIELNSASMSTSLPAAKLARLRSMVREFLGARVVRDHDCRIRAIHVAGINNPITDALSRNRAGSGLIRRSQASPTPTQVPPA